MTAQSIGQLAGKIVNRWKWWQGALRGEFGQITSTPEWGYFRIRGRDGQWETVAIWQDEVTDEWIGERAGRPVSDVSALWVSACRNPIQHAAYEKAMNGGGFDDEPPAPRGIGDNSGSADPLDAIKVELSGEVEQVREFMRKPVESQADADKLGIWAKRLTDIRKRADGEREREKAPHLQASRDVDDKWRPIISEAEDVAKAAKRHVEPFLIAQKRAEEDRQRMAREEADAARRAAAEAARKLQEAAGADDKAREAAAREADRQAAAARAAEAAAEARTINAGRTGARVSVRTEKVGVVTDYAKAAAALVAMNHKDLIAVIDQLAQRAAKAGMPFDGMEVREQERVV